MNKYSETVLENGLKVVTAEVPNTDVVTISVLTKAGSRFEKNGERGYAHILEHMLWRGTKSRPSAYEISLVTDRAGANYNASTNAEIIKTFIQVVKGSVESMVELLSDIVTNPLFNESVLENEKKVVLQEMKQGMDTKNTRLWIESTKRVFGGHPLENSPLGLEKDVQSATSEKLHEYHRKYFVANNMAIVFSGPIKHENAISLSKKYFGKILNGEINDNSRDIVVQSGEDTISFPGTQTTLNFCFSGNKLSQKEEVILGLVANYLGYKHTSLLYQELRHKAGLVYGVGAYLAQFRDAFVFYINTSTTHPDEVKTAVIEKLFKLEDYFTPSILLEYKTQFKNIMMRELDGEFSLNNYFASQWAIHGRMVTPDEVFKIIDSISYEEVMDLTKKIFTKESLFIVRLAANTTVTEKAPQD